MILGCLESALVAQAIAPRTFRAVAGESRTAALSDGVPPMTIITSARTSPPLEFPIRVLMTAAREPLELKLVIPPATPPGDYTVEVSGRGSDGRSISTALLVTVGAVTVQAAAVAARPPVILLNGFQAICTDDASTLTASVDTFGQLATLLQEDGASVLYFNNCTYNDIPIEQLGAQLGVYIAGLRYTDGTPVPQVDLVAHSMGGLIARAYLSGKSQTPGVFSAPMNPMVRKLVTIGTPHFGSFQAGYIGTQESEMALGNQFLWDLATWNQGQEDLRGVDALAIIGNAGTYGTTANASDGVVSLTSGSLGFVETDQRTRIVPYCHIPPNLFTNLGIGMSCSNPEGIAYIDSPTHLSAQIVRSFLAGTTAWQSIGTQPSGDPFLSHYGGGLVALKGTNDVYFTDLTTVKFDSGAGSLIKGPSASIASIFYTEFAAGGSHNFSMTHSNNTVTTGTGTFVDGSDRPLLFKFGPIITGVQSATSSGLGGLTVASGSTIYVYGGGFSGTNLQLTANGAALSISSSTDQQITAYLPGGYNGLVRLEVSNSNGQHTVNIMTAATTPPPAISLSATQASFTYTLGASAPAAQSVMIANSGGGTLSWSASSSAAWLSVSPTFGTGSGTLTLGIATSGLSPQTYNGTIAISAVGASPQTIFVVLTVNATPASPVVVSAVVNAASWTGGAVAPGELVVIGGLMLGPSAGVSGTINPSTGKMVSQLAGTTVLFNGIAAPLLYTSATQVNAIVPYETTGCTQVTLQVEYQGILSAGTTFPCATAAPGVFTFNASGSGPAAAANQDGTFNGPSSPAAKGSYVTLYFTGGGQTNPAGVTGSINGASTLKWLTQGASVTVGGVAATVAFDGAAPTFVDGVLQLNIELSASTPSGTALPVIVSVGNASSPSTATLAVQ